jgi:hypothetical protein
MPIPKALRHLYFGKEVRAWRETLIQRSGDKCELCGKPNGARIQTITGLKALGLRMAWRLDPRRPWRDQNGKVIRRLTQLRPLQLLQRVGEAREIVVVCTAVHKDQMFLCQWCSLRSTASTRQFHAKETRLKAKDGDKPLLADAMEWGKQFEALGHDL